MADQTRVQVLDGCSAMACLVRTEGVTPDTLRSDLSVRPRKPMVRRRVKAVLEHRVVRGAAVVVGGTAGAQFVTLLASPLLTRLFVPDEFGAFSAFAAAAAILAGLGALRLELAVPLARDEGEALHVARLGLLAVLAISSVVLVVSLLLPSRIHDWTGVEPSLQLVLPIYTLGFGTAAILGQLAIRRQQYRLTAQRKMVQSISTVAAQVSSGLAKMGELGLSLGYALGQVIASISLIRPTGIAGGPRSSRVDLLSVARTYRRFPLVLTPSGLLNALGTHAPVLLVVGVFGVTVGGWLGLTQRILAAPVGLVGTSLAQVYIGEMASIHRSGGSRGPEMFRRASRLLWGCALVLAVTVALLSPTLFPILFGDQWVESGHYAQALSVGIAGQLAAAPLSQTLIISGHLGWQVTWDGLRLVVLSAAVVGPGALGWNAADMVWCLGAAQAGVYVLLWLMCRSAAKDIGVVSRHAQGSTSHPFEHHEKTPER